MLLAIVSTFYLKGSRYPCCVRDDKIFIMHAAKILHHTALRRCMVDCDDDSEDMSGLMFVCKVNALLGFA